MTPLDQVRLNIGDTDSEEYYLDDTVITFLLSEHGNSVLDTSIAALEAIVNKIAIQPSRFKVGDLSETRASVDQLENRLQELINKRNAQKYTAIPIILNTDRKDWDDLDKIFD